MLGCEGFSPAYTFLYIQERPHVLYCTPYGLAWVPTQSVFGTCGVSPQVEGKAASAEKAEASAPEGAVDEEAPSTMEVFDELAKELRESLARQKAAEQAAVTTLQAFFHGCKDRKKVEAMKEVAAEKAAAEAERAAAEKAAAEKAAAEKAAAEAERAAAEKAAAEKAATECKFGQDCNNINCSAHHPMGCTIHGERCDGRHFTANGYLLRLCKYGGWCFNEECKFLHPNSIEERKRNAQKERCRDFDSRYKQALGSLMYANPRQGDMQRKLSSLGYSPRDITELMLAFRKHDDNAVNKLRNIKRRLFVEK